MDKSAHLELKNGFREKLKTPAYRRKFIHSMLLFVSFLFLGLLSAQHGTAFLDFAQITGTDVEKASIFYTSMGIGGISGTFIMGILYDKLPRHRLFLLFFTRLLEAIVTVALPWSTNYYLTSVLFFINHISHAAFDSGGNASLMSTWGKEGEVYVQLLHLFQAAGTIIAPFTVMPFLSTISGNSTSCRFGMGTAHTRLEHRYINTSEMTPTNVSGVFNTTGPDCILSESRIQYAYLIAGLLCLVAGTLFVVEGCVFGKDNGRGVAEKEDHRQQRSLPHWLLITTMGLIFSLIFFHCANALIISGYVMAFSVEGLGWTKDEGTLASFGIWVGLGVSRLGGVFIVKFLRPMTIMVLTNTIVMLSLFGMWLSVEQNSPWGIRLCLFLCFFGFGVIFPTLLSYTENEVMKVSGRVTSVIVISMNFQSIVMPPLIGYLMQELSYKWYVYLSLIYASLSFLSFGILVIVVKVFVSKLNNRNATLDIEVDETRSTFIEKSVINSSNENI